MKITVLGSGIGGMTCAALLAKNGFNVTVIEQNSSFGGKSGLIDEKGFKFDTGPSLMTYPEWFDELFELCGKNPREYFSGQWKNWYDFMNVDTSVFIQDKDEFVKFCKEKKININNYTENCEKYKYLPYEPEDFYRNFTFSQLNNSIRKRR